MNYAYIIVSTDMQTVKNQKESYKAKFLTLKKGRAVGKTKAQLARELGCSWHCLHNFMKLKKIP